MAKVFISYSRKDFEFAKRLTAKLLESDWDYWIDWEGIPPTVEWWKEIEKGIEEADTFLFMISPDSVTSTVCRKEIDTAIQNGKRIIPVVVREIEWNDTPPTLAKLNYIFYTRDDSFDRATEKLLNAIHTDYEWAAIHRRLQVKALEWERKNKENSLLLRGTDLQEAESQLVTNSSKNPYPTDLQREYIVISRKASDRQRRITTGISIVGIVALAILAVFGFVQAGLATKNATDSQNNASTAVANQHIAQTAQAKAEEQTRIALARQLSSQAQLIDEAQDNRQMVGVLLAIESMKLDPSIGAFLVLQNNSHAHSILKIKGAIFAVFSHDSKKVLINSQNGAAIYDTQSGEKLAVGPYSSPLQSGRFSPDGRLIISTGSEDSTLRIWDASTGHEIKHYAKHSQSAHYVALTPDNEHALSCSPWEAICIVWKVSTGEDLIKVSNAYAGYLTPDGTNFVYFTQDTVVHVTNIVTGNEVSQLKNGINATGVIFSQDSKLMLTFRNNSPNTDYPYTMWELRTGRKILEKTKIVSATFSLDGKKVLLINQAGECQVFDTSTGRIIDDVKNVYSATFLPDGSLKTSNISGSFLPDGEHLLIVPNSTNVHTIKVVNTETGEEITHVTHDGAWVAYSLMSPDGTKVFSASQDGTGILWGANDVIMESAFLKNDDDLSVGRVLYSPDGKLLLTSGCVTRSSTYDNCVESVIRIWDVATKREISHMTHSNTINDVTFSPNSKLVGSASNDRTARVWDAMTGKEIFEMKHDGIVQSVAFSPDSTLIVSGGDDAKIWEANTGSEITTISGGFSHVAFSPTGNLVAVANSSVIVWDIKANKQVSTLDSASSLFSVAFDPSGKLIVAAGGQANSIIVWDVVTGKETMRLPHDGFASGAMFSKDGSKILSSGDVTVRVWDSMTGEEISRMTHEFSTNSAFFSHDDTMVVSYGDDGTLRIWNATSGNELARYINYDFIYSASLSSDSKSVVFSNGTARIFRWQPNDVIDEACYHVHRNLTLDEWNQYIGDILPYQAICSNLPLEPTLSSTPTPTP